jgi:phosphoribosyl-ATP pyrophosphohydrolase/phosphoribosyl-AMP cyclohydrolase
MSSTTSDPSLAAADADPLLRLDWDKQGGLLPAIVQDAATQRVLMLGYMDRAALARTRGTGRVTFFSRRTQRLWTKGETSGNTLELVSIQADCDRDTLLVQARPAGPTCHLGHASCFPGAPASGVLDALDAVIAARDRDRPEGSYTTSLLASGTARMAQKVGEEGVEVALAAVTGGDAALLSESADLLFHLAVLLRSRGLSLRDAVAELARRLPEARREA